jgi:hypothetical protein
MKSNDVSQQVCFLLFSRNSGFEFGDLDSVVHSQLASVNAEDAARKEAMSQCRCCCFGTCGRLVRGS